MPLSSLSTSDSTDLRDAADTLDSTHAAAGSDDTLQDTASTSTAHRPLPIQNIDELKVLNRRATQEGMYGGMLVGGAFTYALHRLKHPRLTPNALTLTFLLSSTSFSFLYTRARIRAVFGDQAGALAERRLAPAPGGGTFMTDTSPSSSADADSASSTATRLPSTGPRSGVSVPSHSDVPDGALPDTPEAEQWAAARAAALERQKAAAGLATIGAGTQRTRWTKGRGLAGEVEEEPEMRDAYLRPGVPRNGSA